MKTTSTKKTKGLLFTLFVVLASLSSYAQLSASDSITVKNQRFDTLMKHADYIFEGKLQTSKNFKGKNDLEYTSNIYEVTKVIKGNLQKGTVEIVSEAYNQNARDRWNPIYGGSTLNFCMNAKQEVTNSGATKTNSQTLKMWDATVINENKLGKHSPYSAFNYVKTVTELYDLLKSRYNITVVNTSIEKKSPNIIKVAQTTSKPHSEWVKDVLKLKNNKINNRNSSFGCTELFISEYLDGQGSNNAVEIYNPTSSAISLANYKLLIYHNASLTPTSIVLTGTISAYGTHIVAEQGANSYILAHSNQTTNNLNFNGDVCTVLNKGTVHIDKIGEIGVANASGSWTLTPSGGTNNSDIRRKYSISQGDTSWSTCKSEWIALSEDSITNLGSHSNICGVDPDLNYTFANAQIIGNTFQFDIMAASVGANTYLDESAFDMTYNSAVFGTHAVMNNRVQVTLGTNFSDTTNTYYNPQLALGDGQDSLSIIFRTKYGTGTWNRFLITSTPVQLLHVSIQIVNCGGTTNIQYFNTSFTGSFFTDYVANANDDPASATPISYTNVNYPTSALNSTIPACMQITDFNSPIYAGIGNTFSIIGTGFGTTRGKVRFKNADDGGATWLHKTLNADDYVTNWTNTQITIKLPSIIDSANVMNPDSVEFIGGGDFIVTNSSGQSDTSSLNVAGNHFNIVFSLIQVRNFYAPHNKDRINLRAKDTTGGYVFRLNPFDFGSSSTPTQKRLTFMQAVQDWRCMTGANITVGKDTTMTNGIVSDGVSYVFDAPDPSFLAFTQRWPNTCNLDLASLQEADMQISSSFNFAYLPDTTSNIPSIDYDFYDVMLHEIGHYIGLEHNNNVSDLMYYHSNNGNTAANRKHLQSGSAPASGGNYNVAHSLTSLSGSSCWPAMTLGQCSRPAGIDTYINNNFFFNLYPNPSNGTNVNVDFMAPLNTNAQLVVYDMMGRSVYSDNLKNRTDVNTIYKIDLSNLSSGVYMVNLIVDKIKVCQKFIKN